MILACLFALLLFLFVVSNLSSSAAVTLSLINLFSEKPSQSQEPLVLISRRLAQSPRRRQQQQQEQNQQIVISANLTDFDDVNVVKLSVVEDFSFLPFSFASSSCLRRSSHSRAASSTRQVGNSKPAPAYAASPASATSPPSFPSLLLQTRLAPHSSSFFQQHYFCFWCDATHRSSPPPSSPPPSSPPQPVKLGHASFNTRLRHSCRAAVRQPSDSHPSQQSSQRFILFKLLRHLLGVLSRHRVDHFLYYGSLIGALRHHDVVPWDDDVDLAVDARFRDLVERALVLHTLDNNDNNKNKQKTRPLKRDTQKLVGDNEFQITWNKREHFMDKLSLRASRQVAQKNFGFPLIDIFFYARQSDKSDKDGDGGGGGDVIVIEGDRMFADWLLPAVMRPFGPISGAPLPRRMAHVMAVWSGELRVAEPLSSSFSPPINTPPQQQQKQQQWQWPRRQSALRNAVRKYKCECLSSRFSHEADSWHKAFSASSLISCNDSSLVQNYSFVQRRLLRHTHSNNVNNDNGIVLEESLVWNRTVILQQFQYRMRDARGGARSSANNLDESRVEMDLDGMNVDEMEENLELDALLTRCD